MVDFLAAERTEYGGDNLFFVSPEHQHEQIADYYLDYAYHHGWTDCDQSRARQPAEAPHPLPDRLYALLTVPGSSGPGPPLRRRPGRRREFPYRARRRLCARRPRCGRPTARHPRPVAESGTAWPMRGGARVAAPTGDRARRQQDPRVAHCPVCDAWSIGLKAAYTIGPVAKDIFRWIALKGSPRLRQSAVYALYLRWSPATGNFTRELLDGLSREVRLLRPLRTRRILEFLADLSITIYINNCDEPGVTQNPRFSHG